MLELKHIILHKIKLVLRQVQINVNCAKVRKENPQLKAEKIRNGSKKSGWPGEEFFFIQMIQRALNLSFGPSFIVELDQSCSF